MSIQTKTPLTVDEVQSAANTDYIDLTLSNGTRARILKSKLFPIATSSNDGLLPKGQINGSGLKLFTGILTNPDADANAIYLTCNAGYSFFCITAMGSVNFPDGFTPGAVMLEHIQRKEKGDVSASQNIIQRAYTSSNLRYIRQGLGNGTVINWGAWTAF